MENQLIDNRDISEYQELFEYEMTEVLLKLRGELSVVDAPNSLSSLMDMPVAEMQAASTFALPAVHKAENAVVTPTIPLSREYKIPSLESNQNQIAVSVTPSPVGGFRIPDVKGVENHVVFPNVETLASYALPSVRREKANISIPSSDIFLDFSLANVKQSNAAIHVPQPTKVKKYTIPPVTKAERVHISQVPSMAKSYKLPELSGVVKPKIAVNIPKTTKHLIQGIKVARNPVTIPNTTIADDFSISPISEIVSQVAKPELVDVVTHSIPTVQRYVGSVSMPNAKKRFVFSLSPVSKSEKSVLVPVAPVVRKINLTPRYNIANGAGTPQSLGVKVSATFSIPDVSRQTGTFVYPGFPSMSKHDIPFVHQLPGPKSPSPVKMNDAYSISDVSKIEKHITAPIIPAVKESAIPLVMCPKDTHVIPKAVMVAGYSIPVVSQMRKSVVVPLTPVVGDYSVFPVKLDKRSVDFPVVNMSSEFNTLKGGSKGMMGRVTLKANSAGYEVPVVKKEHFRFIDPGPSTTTLYVMPIPSFTKISPTFTISPVSINEKKCAVPEHKDVHIPTFPVVRIEDHRVTPPDAVSAIDNLMKEFPVY